MIVAVGFALWIPELFETRYRMRGTGVCNTAGRLTTAGVQFVVVALFGWGGVAAVVGVLRHYSLCRLLSSRYSPSRRAKRR